MLKENSANDILQVQGINSKGFGTIPKLVMQDKRLTVEAKAIYAYFCSYAGAGQTAFPSRDKIVSDLGMGAKRYYKHFDLLKRYGYIKAEQRHRNGRLQRNIYTLMSEIQCSQNDYTEKIQCGQNEYTQNDYINKSNSNKNIYINTLFSQSSPSIEYGQDKTGQDEIKKFEEEIKENINYSDFERIYPDDIKLVDEIVLIILDVLMSDSESVRIGAEDKPRVLVRDVLMKLHYGDVELILERFKGVTGRIRKKKKYLLAMLYNARMENQADLINDLPLEYR